MNWWEEGQYNDLLSHLEPVTKSLLDYRNKLNIRLQKLQ